MPPRVGAATSGVGDPAFRFLLSVLKHCEQVKTDWNEVAKENGIAYARNASARFKSIIEQHGLKFENGAVTIPEDDGVAGAKPPPPPSSSAENADDEAKPRTKRAKKQTTKNATTATRKRKAPAMADEDEAPAAGSGKKGSGGAKKKMKSEALVKVEEDADAENEEVDQVNDVAPTKGDDAKSDEKDAGSSAETETIKVEKCEA